ncbi:hypothetical protein AB0F81_36240 [Actinoplanes sp. NPDC024001]|uniref:hypothetical protein n=1 Tax=Actinoplanes sp. NPDC024001 TaxID=3154598 RepID=UPI0033ECBDD7
MGATGEELGVDCLELWKAGTYQLQPLGEHLRLTVRHLVTAESGLSALWRDSKLGGPYGPLLDAWTSLADETIRILQETGESLEATGQILVLASSEYQETDDVARRKFEELKPDVVRAQKLAEDQRQAGLAG